MVISWDTAAIIALTIVGAIIGFVVQNAVLGYRIKQVLHEIKPNSGKSMRDVVDRLEVNQETVRTDLITQNADLKAGQEAIAAQVAEIKDKQISWQDDHLKLHLMNISGNREGVAHHG